MTQEYKKAYQEVNKEIDNAKIEQFKKEVRAYKQEQLEQQERLKNEKEKIEEKLRIVKLNLENLDNGKFEAIEERMRKSDLAKQLSTFTWINVPSIWDTNWTGGTYRTSTNNRTFYF